MNAADPLYMARALELARQGLLHPSESARRLRAGQDGQVVGEGWHVRAASHAEVHALRQAGENARGATAYVTLEPCSHFGRTRRAPASGCRGGAGGRGDAGIPTRVGGRGLLRLMQAGIAVQSGSSRPRRGNSTSVSSSAWSMACRSSGSSWR